MAGSLVPNVGRGGNPNAALSQVVAANRLLQESIRRPGEIIGEYKKATQDAEDRKYLLDQRARAVATQNKKLSSDKALTEYAKSPLGTSSMLGSQTDVADKAIADSYDTYNKAVSDAFASKGYDVATAADKMSPDAFQKIISDAGIKDITDSTISAGLQDSYERATPFRKDVESKVLTDLLNRGVDVNTAKAYAKSEGSRYKTVAERQSALDAAAKAKNELAYKKAKYELDVLKASGETKKSSGNSSSSKDYTGVLKAATDLGNDSDVSKIITDSAAMGIGSKAIANALASVGGYDPDTKLYQLTDYGNKDISTKKFKEAIAKYAAIDGSTGRGTSNKVQYPLFPNQAIAGNVEDAASKALLSNVNSFLGVNVDNGSTTVGAKGAGNKDAVKGTEVVAPKINQKLTNGGIGVADSLVASEGITNKSYKLEGEKGYTVAMGYNLQHNDKDIAKDFKAAGIPYSKVATAKNNPEKLVLTDEEATRLSQVSTYKYIDQTDALLKKGGLSGGLDSLSPVMQEMALQMKYRGDLSRTEPKDTGKKYKKELFDLVQKNDLEELTTYINENADTLPKPVVDRFTTTLKYADRKNGLRRGSMTDANKDVYLEEKKVPTKSALEKANNTYLKAKEDEYAKRSAGLTNYLKGGSEDSFSKSPLGKALNSNTSTFIQDSLTAPLLDGYSLYQENIGKPFVRLIDKYAPGGRR